MVVITIGCLASWGAASSGLLAACAVTGVSTGAVVGVACAIADSAKTLSPGALLVKAAASSAIASSIFGISVSGTKTLNAAAISSIAGALSAAGTSALAMSEVAAVILAGPVGSVLLGADGDTNELTYDCWKPVVRDTSQELSRGRLLREVAGSPMIKEVLLLPDSQTQAPQLFLHNVWDERFRIDFGFLPSGEFAAHAIRMK